ncbi:30S ribosomal protein S7, chloroplastic [Termitomyces sp. T112]|nr:30S ribosomal protein S7, chloroplastic [Termitomyces sp. T112]
MLPSILPSLRLTARRWLPTTTTTTTTARAFAAAAASRDQATLDLAMDELGQARAMMQTPSVPSIPRPTTPTIMDIPPAEDPLLYYVTSHLMRHGHRARASRIVSNILLHIHAWTRAPPLPILRQAVLDAAPAVRTVSHRSGGKTTFKPTALSEKKRMYYALKHIKDASRARPGRSIEERMAREMINIVEGVASEAVKMKRKMHEFATVNRGNIQTRF